ncbi:hypothetical protein BO70DRAFT_398680 [Aspergillus heteromorphus CBS 117.55]|uniref:Uncharacterized protein n=1 Tax=Aspergillus heteromorphus CBS 117.55 TaxID=1448321 RepID=A0A317VNC3_9EURO|nr:uncharacterized protein BO70DRAFT_398680 [Aspergillus heteromorphus CBS 117.55]PWY74352.1 hypothetical protein BO70DRAFT_398680 [Aspergillus heteromorphus CBS 117.55]
MASYHRVLAVFGRSVKDKALECDCDIHPWEIKINGEQWPGKIRLIGFVDVFFLFSYSANARFERGIIVYKERYDIERLLKQIEDARSAAGPPPTAPGTSPALEDKKAETVTTVTEIPPIPSEDNPATDSDQHRRLSFDNDTSYKVTSWGHEVGLKSNYPISSVGEWNIEISKPYHRALRRRIKRAIKEHTTTELLEDVARCGFIAQGQFIGNVASKYLVGGVLDDTLTKYMEGLVSGDKPGHVALANEGF